jgi:16S rRNA (cytidine1402-2'-O)-methyltransferase
VTGALFLLPNLLGEGLRYEEFFPPAIEKIVHSLDGLIAESEKGGWRFLRHFFSHEKISQFPVRYLNEHTPKHMIEEMLKPMTLGEKWGLISDAGIPSIADPGASLVFEAHRLKIPVTALAGPSSIILALQLSGFPAQSFSFHGYLPIEVDAFREKIRFFEKEGTTHLWIETPYRVQKSLQIIVDSLSAESYFCLALDLTLPTQEVIVEKVKDWKKRDLSLFNKRRAIFLLGKPDSKKSFGH